MKNISCLVLAFLLVAIQCDGASTEDYTINTSLKKEPNLNDELKLKNEKPKLLKILLNDFKSEKTSNFDDVKLKSEVVIPNKLRLNTNFKKVGKDHLKFEKSIDQSLKLKSDSFKIDGEEGDKLQQFKRLKSEGNQIEFQNSKIEEKKLKSQNSKVADEIIKSDKSNDLLTTVKLDNKKIEGDELITEPSKEPKSKLVKLIVESGKLMSDKTKDANLKGYSNGYNYYKCKNYYDSYNSYNPYNSYGSYGSYPYDSYNSYNSYNPYNSYGSYGSYDSDNSYPYNSYGSSYNSYNSYDSYPYNSYNSYNSYDSYGSYDSDKYDSYNSYNPYNSYNSYGSYDSYDSNGYNSYNSYGYDSDYSDCYGYNPSYPFPIFNFKK